MYKLNKNSDGDLIGVSQDAVFIPFDPANTDYSNFKKEVLNGAELQDSDGDVMTPDAAMAFISNLP